VDAAGGLRLTVGSRGQCRSMHLKKTLAAVMIAGTAVLTGCGGTNTDVDRGETNCDGGDTNSQDQNCAETSTPDPAENT
jgi:hypothetical protein